MTHGDVSIRQLAGADELELVAPLWKALQAHHLSVGTIDVPARDPEASWAVRRAMYERGLAKDAWLWVAEQGGQPLGYAYVEPGGAWATWDAGPTANLETLVVAPGARGGGIGERLVQTAADACRAAGFTHLGVGYIEGNDRAAAFYAREGFTPVERVLAMPL